MTQNAAPAVTARDIAEASAVTSQSSGHQFEIQLGHLCNNRCVFCSSGQLTEMKLARPVPYDQIARALQQARASGASRLVFLGGEPTLHKRFVDACALAQKLGFEEVVIFTNGVRLPTPGFVESIIALGRFTWRISIQGGNEAAHVAVTKRSKSFQRIAEGMAKLRRYGQRVTTNICVNAQSYRSLPDFPELVKTFGIAQLHLDIVRPASTGMRTREYLNEIITPYSHMVPYYRRMLEGFEADDPSFDVNVGNLPYCLMPEWGHKIHHAGDNTVTQSAGAQGLENVDDKYAVHRSQRTYTERCGACVFRARCTGVFKQYLALYGDDEFQPISLDRLRGLDPNQRNFDLLVAPLLRPVLEDHALPSGWSRPEVFVDVRDRRIDVHYARRDRSGSIRLAFIPKGATPSKDLAFATNHYQVGLRASGKLSKPHVIELLKRVAATAVGHPSVTCTFAPDPDSIGAQLKQSALLGRARLRVDRLVQKVQRRRRFGTWFYGGMHPLQDREGARLRIHGPEGYQVDLVIEASTERDKNQVNVRFDLGPETTQELARPVIEELVATLRSR